MSPPAMSAPFGRFVLQIACRAVDGAYDTRTYDDAGAIAVIPWRSEICGIPPRFYALGHFRAAVHLFVNHLSTQSF